MKTCKISLTPTTKEPKICHALAITSAFNLKLCLRSLLFYTTFSWCWKTEEKTKNICEGHTNIFIWRQCIVNIKQIPPEAFKVSTLIKLFDVEKSLACYVFKIWRSNCCNHNFTYIAASVCPQQGSQYQIQGQSNFQPFNLENRYENFLFWLRVWLSGGLAETSLN